MFPETKIESKDYITLSLPPIQAVAPPTRSLRRRWNQLPRLLRVLAAMIIVAIIIFIFIIWATTTSPDVFIFKDATPLFEKSIEEQMKLDPNKAPKIDIRPLHDNKITLPSKINKEQFKNDVKIVDNIEKPLLGLEGGIKQKEIIPKDQLMKSITSRQEAVVEAMKHAWLGYKKFAWGYDHLLPQSQMGQNWMGLGLTIIDSLDTLWIMGLKKEFDEARNWVSEQLSFAVNKEVNLFETTIRVLGGLLSAFHLSKDDMFLQKATDLGDRLLGAFESPSGVPYSDVNLITRGASKPRWGPDSSTSEVSTVQLEFRELSATKGNPIYGKKVNKVMRLLHDLNNKLDGLVPMFINAGTGHFRSHATITLGARADSYYEYLLKQWIQMGGTEDRLKSDYLQAVSAIEFHLVKRSKPNRLLFIAELHGAARTPVYKMDELVCYLPGTLVLGVYHGMPKSHLKLAYELMDTCIKTWQMHPTGLAAEITFFNVDEHSKEDMFVKSSDSHYLLRPETIESLWYLFHLTGNTTYQEWGWNIFQGIEQYCKVPGGGYSSISDVMHPQKVKPKNKMESFFLAETLKYFFLLFSKRSGHFPDISKPIEATNSKAINQPVDYSQNKALAHPNFSEFNYNEANFLKKFVFNTEGHPLPIYSHNVLAMEEENEEAGKKTKVENKDQNYENEEE